MNITLYKLWAFALASFMTGVAGGLLASQLGQPTIYGFPIQDSLILLAVVLIGGIFSLWGAVVAGVFMQLVPFIFQAEWKINTNFLLIIFGAGLLQVLLTAPGGLADQVPEGPGEALAARRRGRSGRREREVGVIEVEGLTVRFAGVTPIDDMSVTFPGGACGLIGPNGAGKTTFFNVLSGFVRPAAGSIRAFGEDLLKMVDYRRARWGLRRTFQTEQAIEKLSVFDNVAMIHEHSGGEDAPPGARRSWTRSSSSGSRPRRTAKVGGRSAPASGGCVEIARAVVGQPRVVLLDEPAAGLPDEETVHLGEVIRRIPEEFGALVILVDHDMSLVSACCETTAVLDFGKLIASGPTAEVLRNEHVIRAYLGTEEEL